MDVNTLQNHTKSRADGWGRIVQAWLVLSLSFFPLWANAETSQRQNTTRVPLKYKENRVWLRVHVVRAEIWPLNARGECWDPCGWSTPKLPPRELKPYAWYFKDPAFRKLTKGWQAPDIQIQIRIGKQVIKTPVQHDTTQPSWKFSSIVSVLPSEGWEIKVVDVDTWGEDLVGVLKQKPLPLGDDKERLLSLRKFGQVELLQLRLELLGRQQRSQTIEPKPTVSTPPSSRSDPNPNKEPRVAPPIPRPMPTPRTEPKQSQKAPKTPAPPLAPSRPGMSFLHTPPPSSSKPNPLSSPQKGMTKPPIPPLKSSSKEPKVAKNMGSPTLPKSSKHTSKRPIPPKRREKPKRSMLVRLRIVSVCVWPLRKSGHCWDGCWTQTTNLPPRGMPFFEKYLTQPSFRRVATGMAAPDVWVELGMGKRKWKTSIKKDTVTPRWKSASWIVRIVEGEDIHLSVFDQDLFSSELIGQWKHRGIPASWWQGGRLLFKSFGQVERLELSVEPLEQLRGTPTSVPVLTTQLPSQVRFVRVTVVKARIWPLTQKGQCWDTCSSWKPPVLPPRGLKSYAAYMKHKGFVSVATGRSAPDPRVKVQLGKYDVYITPTQENTVQPVWQATHIFRLRGNESMTITVSDDDQNFAHDLLRTYRSTKELMARWAEDEIGRYHTKHLPIQMIQGGTLILRSFGQVDYLELKIEPVPMRTTRPGCEGVYRVRIAEMEVAPKRADGRPWNAGVGSLSQPSPYVSLWLGGQKIETPVAYKRLNAIFQTSRIVAIHKATTMSIEARDATVGFSLSVDRQIKIPFLPLRFGIGVKNEPDSQLIGQTAFFSVCPLLKKSEYGVVSLPAFGQVRKMILFFDKIS